jgi:hypothetical protein
MVIAVVLVTIEVVIVKVALVFPLGIVTFAGTVAARELSLNDTTKPPVGAVPLNVTVPWEESPPVTLDGLKVTETNAGKTVMVTFAVLLLFVPSFAM